MTNQKTGFRVAEFWANRKQYAFSYLSVLAFVLVYVIYALVYRSTILCAGVSGQCTTIPPIDEFVGSLVLSSQQASSALPLLSFSGRIGWSVSIGLSLFFIFVAFITATFIVARVRYLSRWSYPLPLIAAIVLGLFLADLPGVEGAPVSPWRQFIHTCMNADFAYTESLTRLLDLSGLIVAIYLPISLSVYFSASIGRDDKWSQDLSSNVRVLSIALYVGAALLITGIFRIWAILSWSLDYVDTGVLNHSQQQILDSATMVAAGIVSSRGALYTMLLASLYLPGVMFLSSRMREATSAGALSETEQQKLDDMFTPRENLLRLAAILGPVLTGPAADYLSHLS